MLKAGQRLGSYVVVSHLADGGTSEVYLVQAGAQRFALKILKASLAHFTALQARLLNEAVTLEALRIPGVVQVFGNGDFQGRPYFVMEYLPGSLAQKLTLEPSLAEVLALAESLGRILSALHARGIVHRDVKPQNVLFSQSGELRLIDFSHAKLPSDDEAVVPHSTETGAFLGTRDYAAPEQMLNAKGVDGRADVYALGVLLFEGMCGRRPFAAATDEELARQRLTRRAPRLSSLTTRVPPPLDRLLAQMLERSPRNRPTAAELLVQFASIPRQYAASSSQWHWAAIPLLLTLSCPSGLRSLSDLDEVLDEEPLDNAVTLLSEAGPAPLSSPQAAEQTQKRADLLREQGYLAPAASLYAEAGEGFAALKLLKQQADSETRLADMYLHQGRTSDAYTLYEDAQSLRGLRAARRETPGGREFFFTPYRFGLFYMEQGDWDKARKKLREARDAAAAIGPLWLARTEERLASLPGEQDGPALAQAALQHADIALHQQPDSRRARMVYLRAQFRLGTLRQDEAMQRTALEGLRSVWSQDMRRGLWAHDFVELLMEGLRSEPGRADLKAQAASVLNEMHRRSQWQDDVHVQRWRDEIRALEVRQDGVMEE